MNRQSKPPLTPPLPTSAAVSAVMRGNRGHDTKPELTVRRLLFAEGYRYRTHPKDLPGRPDIAFTGRKKAILVHGCFWHQHSSDACRLRSHPKSNTSYWAEKLRRNRNRDIVNERQLHALGWDVLVIWECETRDATKLLRRLKAYLGLPSMAVMK